MITIMTDQSSIFFVIFHLRNYVMQSLITIGDPIYVYKSEFKKRFFLILRMKLSCLKCKLTFDMLVFASIMDLTNDLHKSIKKNCKSINPELMMV